MKLTHDTLHELFNEGAPNSAQLHLLGLPRQVRSGWMKPLIGTEIPDVLYSRLLELRGRKPKGAKVREWRQGRLEF